jgi:hypothetical protein
VAEKGFSALLQIILLEPTKANGSQSSPKVTAASLHHISPGVRSLKGFCVGVEMKRIATFILLAAFTVGATLPVYAQRENRSIGENGSEARKAAKQQRKYVNKNAKKQRKAMKKYQKAQRKQGKKPGRSR